MWIVTLKHEVDRVDCFNSNTEVARSELTLRAGEWVKVPVRGISKFTMKNQCQNSKRASTCVFDHVLVCFWLFLHDQVIQNFGAFEFWPLFGMFQRFFLGACRVSASRVVALCRWTRKNSRLYEVRSGWTENNKQWHKKFILQMPVPNLIEIQQFWTNLLNFLNWFDVKDRNSLFPPNNSNILHSEFQRLWYFHVFSTRCILMSSHVTCHVWLLGGLPAMLCWFWSMSMRKSESANEGVSVFPPTVL